VPETVPEIIVKEGTDLASALIEAKIITSKTDWRRLVDEGAVTDIEQGEITDPKIIAHAATFKIGKKRFVKIIVEGRG